MLLAICIFLILTVLGINVLAASYSNVQNMKSKYETEQSMQYVNSIYEILDKKIQAGVFVLGDYLSGTEADPIKTNQVKLTTGHSEEVLTRIEFSRGNSQTQLKAEVFVKYRGREYCVTSIYEANGSGSDGKVTYTLSSCKGVTSIETSETE